MKNYVKPKEELKTAQFHYRCSPKKMEKIKKEAASHNITVQEYFDTLIARDIGLISSQMDLITYQLSELKKRQELIFLNTDLIGKYLNRYLLLFYSHLNDFKSEEEKKEALDKARKKVGIFKALILQDVEKNDKSFLSDIFDDSLKDDNYLADLYSRLMMSNTKNH